METEQLTAADFAYLRVPLPEEPPRRPRGWRSDTRQRVGSLVTMAALIASIMFLRALTGPAAGLSDGLLALQVLASVAGFVVLPGGALEIVRCAQLAHRQRRHPDEPWLWDHAWDPRGTSVTPLVRLRRQRGRFDPWRATPTVVYMSFFLLFAVRSSWALLVPLGLWLSFVARRVWRAHGVGTAHVYYSKFPFHPDEPVTLYFGMSEGGASFERAEFFLRRIREVTVGRLPQFRGAYATYQLRLCRPPGMLPGPDQEVELVFDVRPDAGGTSLSAHLPEYWVLDVVAATSAGPYTESFLVPIYERPASGHVEASSAA